jgi:hypothetical protein
MLRVGESVVGGEDEEGDGGPVILETLVAEELGAIDLDMSKITKFQSAVHQLPELRSH